MSAGSPLSSMSNSLTPFGSSWSRPSDQWYNYPMQSYGMSESQAAPIIRPFTPLLSADLIEGANDFHVMCDLPGVDKADLDVMVNEGVLTIKAHRREVIKQDIDTYHRTERNFGKVSRTIQIPHNVDISKVTCKFEGGVLYVSLPKLPKGKWTKLTF